MNVTTPDSRGAAAPDLLSSGPASTKAVLQALRALQGKISRLERERSKALDEASEMRVKFQMAAATSAAQRETEASDRARKDHGYGEIEDRLQRERDELRAALEIQEAEHAKAAEAHVLAARIADESAAAAAEKLAQAVSTVASLETEVRHAQADVGHARRARADCDERLAVAAAKHLQLELRNESLESALQTMMRQKESPKKLKKKKVAARPLPLPPPPRPRFGAAAVPPPRASAVSPPQARLAVSMSVSRASAKPASQAARKAAAEARSLRRPPPAPKVLRPKRAAAPSPSKAAPTRAAPTRLSVNRKLTAALAEALQATDDPEHLKTLGAIFQSLAANKDASSFAARGSREETHFLEDEDDGDYESHSV
ncbi:hypothetical protein M885DRAFT_513271 [Pelagophyceae sp. CCMP2097]|nr:hypothetical protein M885DRAFT_513271 [Pelagophyceae sp. CCMP2097]